MVQGGSPDSRTRFRRYAGVVSTPEHDGTARQREFAPHSLAPNASAEPGLAQLHATLQRIAERRSLRSLLIVVDDRDLGRQAFRVGDRDFDAGQVARTPGCHAEPQLEDVEAELLVALCAASLRVQVLEGPEDASAADALELAIRRAAQAGVVAVQRDGEIVVARVIAGPDTPTGLADDVGQELRGLLVLGAAAGAVIEILREAPAPALRMLESVESRDDEGVAPPGTAEPAVEVVAVHTAPEHGEIEVHLRRGDVRTIGRSPMGNGLVGTANATLDALAQLGLPAFPQVAWARTVETTSDRRFVVAVALSGPNAAERAYGMASGKSPIEAAARATLDAIGQSPSDTSG